MKKGHGGWDIIIMGYGMISVFIIIYFNAHIYIIRHQ